MRDWADGDTLNSGSATFILASRARGISEAELRETLTGNARLQITRGDFNIHDGHKPSEKAPPETVPFDVFSSSWLGREGVARTDDFTIESPKMQVRGKGQVDLRNETIDLSVMAVAASRDLDTAWDELEAKWRRLVRISRGDTDED